ncbi:Wzz/FepE/Etk N-terminal domain-containing protein [Sphingomonas sp. BGYR3]|uniref:XrtA system polysaccharide chain length determinant n=1 Tax=Sphingomonas sp. BGYR3 TaxID=2975483 RepID=UPI0021A41976|nr:XrtA system polysaccharide chain length determinant [Sphingomonas sp. BGYR3]MDG5487582.1 Wzz/FepE/Etk N-terminal domain-containing protein [Sphingomonas sp. BGYR3]
MDGIYDEIRAAIHGIWHRRWLALAVAWAICLAGWFAVSLIPSKYESTARVLVQSPNLLPNEAAGAQARMDQAREVERVRQTLTSAINLEKVVRGTELARRATTPGAIAGEAARLQKAVKITAQQDNLFEVTASISNPDMTDGQNARLARAVVQKMIDIFVEDNLSQSRDGTGQSLRFLDEQIALRQRQLQDKENQLADFNNRFLSGLPGTGSLSDRIGQARTALADVDAQLAGASSSLSAVNAQMGGTPAMVAGAAGAPMAGPARARLAAIESQLAEGRSRGWTDSHPDMRALNSQLAQARTAAAREGTGGAVAGQPNPVYIGLRTQQAEREARVAELSQRKGMLEGQLSQLQRKLDADPNAAAAQAQLDRDIDALRETYRRLVEDREQVRLTGQVQAETAPVRFKVIDPPTVPGAPASPNRPLLLAAVLIAGIGGGAAAAFAFSRIQTTWPTADRLERSTGLPVIGSISEVVLASQTPLRRKRLMLFAGGAGGLFVAFVALIGVNLITIGMMA